MRLSDKDLVLIRRALEFRREYLVKEFNQGNLSYLDLLVRVERELNERGVEGR